MRMRQKLTVGGAVVLAAGAIGGGALVTSRAMAGSDVPPLNGTFTIVSIGGDSSDGIRCVYDDIVLPGVPALTASASASIAAPMSPGMVDVLTSTRAAPVGVAGVPAEGVMIDMYGSATAADGSSLGVPGMASLVVGADGVNAAAGGSIDVQTGAAGPLATAPDVGIREIRNGTDEECSAMRPDVGSEAWVDEG